VAALTQMYIQGVSTRKVTAISEELCGHSFSASAISEINKKLDTELGRFARRELESEYLYLIIDARYEKLRENGVIRSRAVLVAIGIDWEGRRQVLGVEMANRESSTSWKEFLLGLKRRGLRGVFFAVSDDHPGLKRRVSESLCVGHNLREGKMTKEKKETKCDDLIDALLEEHGISQEAVLGENGLIAQLKKRVVERALAGELTHHLGYAKGEAPEEIDNHRNGYSKKTVVGEDGAMEIEVPRDRSGSFEPLLIAKGQKRFEGFDEKIIAMYARGMTVREIAGFLLDHYKVEVSADFISTVTDSVLEAVVEWQNRPLERSYPVIYFDALRVKIRDEGSVRNKAVYLALGIASDGTRDVLGIWIEQNEGAKFWLKVMNELRNRGVEDILIAVVDGLKGFPEAITTVFPLASVQTCIVHLSRYCLSFCGWKERQAVARELKAIYRAETAEAAAKRLSEFDAGPWGKKYPMIAESWRRNWEHITPFYSYPPEVRKIIYTTNAIESLHMQLRKVLKNRGHFPSDEAATKLIYLALRNITKSWTNPPLTWRMAANQFAIQFGQRFNK
jgi:putative transposase